MMGGAPIAAGTNGEVSPLLSAIAVMIKVIGKPTPKRKKPAKVSNRASARKAAGLGRTTAMSGVLRNSRHSRTRTARVDSVARTQQAQAIVLQENRGFHHPTLRRRNYNYI